jgi:DNA-binding NarL/FixJ family response regulator
VEALQRAREFKGPIHVLLASIEMPDMTGIELAERLNQERPEMKVLFLAALRSGMLLLSHGWHFLPAPFESEMLRDRVLDFISEPQPATRENSPAEDTVSRLGKLTKREVQVLRLIAVGNSTKQVAAQLGIAFKTSVGHRSSLMKKLGIHDSVALVRYAIRAGLIDP